MFLSGHLILSYDDNLLMIPKTPALSPHVGCTLRMHASAMRGMRGMRTFTNVAPKPKASLGKTMSLDHFIQRTKTLSFYRTIMRGIYKIPDPATREESRNFARGEFERHRDVTDIGHIRYLLSTGKTEWDSMKRYIGL